MNNNFNAVEYDLPKGQEVVVDAANDKIIDRELTPYDKIKAVATEQGIKISEPDPKCKQCYGRGYLSLESKTQMPNPCMCIFEREQRDMINGAPLKKNREQRRLQERQLRKQIALFRNKTGKSKVTISKRNK